MSKTIWTNHGFRPEALELFKQGLATAGHKLVHSPKSSASVLAAGASDPSMNGSDIAFGQPDVGDVTRLTGLRWVALTTAGYTRYDTSEFRAAMTGRGTLVTSSSAVFADPCAQHVLAMMLSLGRQLLPSHRDQLTDQSWHYEERRYHSRLLTGQSVLMLGYGAIGLRLTELLAPFGMTLYALRRQTRSETGVRIVPETELTRVLPLSIISSTSSRLIPPRLAT